jgi:hypothetical protein
MNSAGNIGPPMNPLAWLTAKVKIFAITVAASRPAPERARVAQHRLEHLLTASTSVKRGHKARDPGFRPLAAPATAPLPWYHRPGEHAGSEAHG